jgi:predicted lipid-binding transport protein (Tim44 family)
MMGLTLDPLNIILIAAAIVIFWRLKSVLGQRTGLERKPAAPVLKLVSDRTDIEPNKPVDELDEDWHDYAEKGSDLAQGLAAIAKAQNDFSVTAFIAGAKSAYEMILEAFAKGEKATLKPLLAKPVFETFAAEIENHQKTGNPKIFQFVGFKSADIKSAKLENKMASITIHFISEMITATTTKEGQVISGNPTAVAEVVDSWTFERDVTSRDPNWRLVATGDVVE